MCCNVQPLPWRAALLLVVQRNATKQRFLKTKIQENLENIRNKMSSGTPIIRARLVQVKPFPPTLNWQWSNQQ